MRTKDKIFLAGIGLIAGALISLSFSSGLFFGLENFFEDLLVSEKPVSDKIVIVAVDDESLIKIGQWPWPREVFARALENLEKNPPAAVGIDVIFADPSRLGKFDDLKIVKALRNISYPVIMPVEANPLRINPDGSTTSDSYIKPLPEFQAEKSVTLAHVNLILDADGIVRRFPSEIGEFSAFPSEVSGKSGLLTNEQPSGIRQIAYSGAPGKIRRIPFWRLLEDKNIDLSGKIVLIGATSADLHDEKLTPMSRGTEMPGVEIQANIVNMLLQNYRMNPAPKVLMVFWLMLISLISASMFIFTKKSLHAVFFNLIFALGNLIAVILLFEYGISANLVHIILSVFLATGSGFGYRYAITEKEKREMKNLFSKYVSSDVLNEILKNPESVSLGGEEKEVTVFFSDIRGFTTLSEKTSPKELVHILNRYFTVMTNEVLKNGGVLDKYIGDAIMAFWGAPIENPDQADKALQASLGMISALEKLNKELKAKGDPEIGIGIGLYTGPAIVGNVGSDLRFDYTVIGDTVNIASRLEGLNKEYGTRIIIGETTKNKLKGNYRFKSLGSVAVKGRKEPLNIYSVEI